MALRPDTGASTFTGDWVLAFLAEIEGFVNGLVSVVGKGVVVGVMLDLRLVLGPTEVDTSLAAVSLLRRSRPRPDVVTRAAREV